MHRPEPATPHRTRSTAELRRIMTPREIAAAVASGRLVKIRRGQYLEPSLPSELLRAATLHGRLDCVSLLRVLGVFVRDDLGLHLQMEVGTTDVPVAAVGVVRHWRASGLPSEALSADIVGALVQACRCQPELAAIATLDSAWHQRLVDADALTEVFSRLPQRLGRLRAHLDPRSEAGPETILRVLLRGRGYRVDIQVHIDGVGRVDLVVDGWLIIECDSEAHHSGWANRRRDARRDQAAAAQGYTTVRPIAEDILWHTDTVLRGIVGLVRAHAEAAVRNLAVPASRVRL